VDVVGVVLRASGCCGEHHQRGDNRADDHNDTSTGESKLMKLLRTRTAHEDRDGTGSLGTDHRHSGWLHLTQEERTEVWLYIVVPQVVFWLLLLFAPASSWLGWAERIGLGASVTAVLVPLMLVRIKN
jgi:hypothetical protein